MKRQHSTTTNNEIKNLFANPEIALITGFSVVIGAALLVVMLVTIGITGALIQQVATGTM